MITPGQCRPTSRPASIRAPRCRRCCGHVDERSLPASRTDSLRWLEADEEILALDLDRSAYLGVNAAGALLWRSLAEGATRGALVDRLIQAFGVTSEQAGADVDRFVAQLADASLLET
jgi:Coenzyme PQQ synthesis protein D (PqqD)